MASCVSIAFILCFWIGHGQLRETSPFVFIVPCLASQARLGHDLSIVAGLCHSLVPLTAQSDRKGS
jgi:hypothetical protein